MIDARRLASTKPKQGADSIPANCLELPYRRSFFLPTVTVVDSDTLCPEVGFAPSRGSRLGAGTLLAPRFSTPDRFRRTQISPIRQ